MDGDFGLDDVGSGQEQQGDGHPAWNDVLGKIPQEFHSEVKPYFESWDKGVSEKINKVHQEYEPWKPIIKNSDPDTTRFAVQLLGAIEQDPVSVYRALGEFYKDQIGESSKPGQGQNESKDQEEKPWLADLAEIKHQNEMLTRVLTTQQQAQNSARADAALDHELSEAKKKHGEYDERYVLGLINANSNLSVDQAVQSWRQSVQQYAEKMGFAGPKPMFLGGGSNIPGNNVNLKSASDKEVKDVVQQMLMAAAQQNKQ